jgi:hypothetical protein
VRTATWALEKALKTADPAARQAAQGALDRIHEWYAAK